MKHYLADFICQDGAHQHSYQALIRAYDMEQAKTIAQSHEYDCGDDDGHDWDYSDNLPLTAFGDGLTACRLRDVSEIDVTAYDALKALGVVTEIDLVVRVAIPEKHTNV